MEKLIYLIIIIFLVTNNSLLSISMNDSCFYLLGKNKFPGYIIENPDSVLIDSCACSGIPWEQCEDLYAKKWFHAVFPYGVFNLPEYPYDTTIYVTLEDMDTNYAEIKQRFFDLEKSFGSYLIIKDFPDLIDSSFPARSYQIVFNDYCKIDSVKNFMEMEDEDWFFNYNSRVSRSLSGISDHIDKNDNDNLIYPNPASNKTYIIINFSYNERLSIKLYNTLGMELKTIANEYFNEGENTVSIDVSDLPNGVYLIVISYDGGTVVENLVVSR